jgi:hypothetical protein
MLESTRQRLLDSLAPDAVVLDVGGWADPFERADWVIDVMPYETRGLYQREGWVTRQRDRERFSERTWIQRDLCSREPFPFADKSIDFVVCSHTLEDLRDPVWVCGELNRVAQAGYIEVPSRLEEQSWGVNGPFVGWSHHRWLIDLGDHEIEFVLKLHSLHGREDQQFPPGFWQELSEQERVQTMWWSEGFSFRERIMLQVGESDRYLGGFVERELAARSGQRPALRRDAGGRLRRLPGRRRRPRRR